MGSTATLLLGAAIVAAIGFLGFWLTLRRRGRAIARRQRDEALAASSRYTPAERACVYGTAAPDPCAPGLTDGERVAAMRALLLRTDPASAQTSGSAFAEVAFAPTQPMERRDPGPTTSPMAWKPTQALEGDDALLEQRGEADREHITI